MPSTCSVTALRQASATVGTLAPKSMLMVTSMSTLPSRKSTEMPGVPLSPRSPARARALPPPSEWIPSMPEMALNATLATTLSEMVTPLVAGASALAGSVIACLLVGRVGLLYPSDDGACQTAGASHGWPAKPLQLHFE